MNLFENPTIKNLKAQAIAAVQALPKTIVSREKAVEVAESRMGLAKVETARTDAAGS